LIVYIIVLVKHGHKSIKFRRTMIPA